MSSLGDIFQFDYCITLTKTKIDFKKNKAKNDIINTWLWTDCGGSLPSCLTNYIQTAGHTTYCMND